MNMPGPEYMSKTKEYWSISCPVQGCKNKGWKQSWSECQGWLVNHLAVSTAESHKALSPEEKSKMINTTEPHPLSEEEKNAWFEHERYKAEGDNKAWDPQRGARSSSNASGQVSDGRYQSPAPVTPRRRSRSRRRNDRERDRDRDRRRDRAARGPAPDHEEPPPEGFEEELQADESHVAQRPETRTSGAIFSKAPGIRPTTSAVADAVQETLAQMGIQAPIQQMQPPQQPPQGVIMAPARAAAYTMPLAIPAPLQPSSSGAAVMALSTPLQSAGHGGSVLVSTQFLKNISECITRAQNACHMAKMLSQKSMGVFASEEAILGACVADIEKALNMQGASLQGPM